MEGARHHKLKVAIIHPDLGIGGAERLIVDAAVELALHGHNVHVFTAHHDKNRCFEETVSGKFKVTVYGSFLPRHFFYHFHAVCAYMREIKKANKDLLLAQCKTWIHRVYRKPINFLEERTTGMADLILVNSKFTKLTFAATFHQLHLRGVEPAVLYPAVSVKQFGEHFSYKPNFLSINRFERKKNLQLAISAFALLSSSFNSNEVTLTIAGGFDQRLKENVEYFDELKKMAKVQGVSDRVKFVTSCTTAERNALLAHCICVLYTPKDEHFGIVPLEAMASQKPVIACNSGGPVETVKHEATGFLCDPTPSEFSKAMSKLLSDTDLAVRMGQEARRHVAEMFSTEKFGDQLNRYVLDAYHHRIE